MAEETFVYSPEAERACAYLQEVTGGEIGCGEDPVGFLIASHRSLRAGQQACPPSLSFPRELTPELLDVLGLPNFQTGPMAHAFRDASRAEIRRKCEDEQAFILHWLVMLVLEHGEDWRRHASATLSEVIAEARARRGEGLDATSGLDA